MWSRVRPRSVTAYKEARTFDVGLAPGLVSRVTGWGKIGRSPEARQRETLLSDGQNALYDLLFGPPLAALVRRPASPPSGRCRRIPVVQRGVGHPRRSIPRQEACSTSPTRPSSSGPWATARATLTVDGLAVAVAPNGAWLAWVAVPQDSAVVLRLEARLGEPGPAPATAAAGPSRVGATRGGVGGAGSLQPHRQTLAPRRRGADPQGRGGAWSVGAAAAARWRGDSLCRRRPGRVAPAGRPAPSSATRRSPSAARRATLPRRELDGETGLGRGDWLRSTSRRHRRHPVTRSRARRRHHQAPLAARPCVARDASDRGAARRAGRSGRERIGSSSDATSLAGPTTGSFPTGPSPRRMRATTIWFGCGLATGATAWVPLAEVVPQRRRWRCPGRAVMGSLTLYRHADRRPAPDSPDAPGPHQVQATPSGLTITLFGVDAATPTGPGTRWTAAS